MCINYIVTRTHFTTWPLFSHLTGRGRPSEMVRLCGCSDDDTWLMDFYWIHRKPRHWSLAPGHKLQSSTARQASILWTPPLRYQQPSVCLVLSLIVIWHLTITSPKWSCSSCNYHIRSLRHIRHLIWSQHCKYHRMLSSCHKTGLL